MIHVLLTKFRKPSALAGGFLFCILLLFSCASTNKTPSVSKDLSYLPNQIIWQKIDGISFAEYFTFKNENIPLCYHCIKIDLSSENLKIITYPASKDDFIQKKGKQTDFFAGITAEEFSERFDSAITVNATPFQARGLSGKMPIFSSARKICGIHIADKKLLSPPLKKYGVFCLKKNEDGFTGKILKNQEEKELSEYDFAFGGFFVILHDSKKEEFQRKSSDSRTALALSRDGKTLYLLAVEGEKKSQSIGLSYQDCADITLALGASDALQMDGGGSTSLFVNNKNFLSYSSLRKNAVFIGFSKTGL